MTPLLHTSSKHISERYTNTKTRLGITQQTPRQRKSSTLNKALFQSLGFGVYEHHRPLKCVKIKHHLGATNKLFDTKSISLQKMRWFHTTSEPINHPKSKSIPCVGITTVQRSQTFPGTKFGCTKVKLNKIFWDDHMSKMCGSVIYVTLYI